MRCCLSGTYPGGGELRPVFWEPGPERRTFLIFMVTEMGLLMHVHKTQTLTLMLHLCDHSSSGVNVMVWTEMEPEGAFFNEHLQCHFRHYEFIGEAANKALAYFQPLLFNLLSIISASQRKQWAPGIPGFWAWTSLLISTKKTHHLRATYLLS